MTTELVPTDGHGQAEPLPSQRSRFDLPADIAYLNCAYMAPQLAAVTEAGERAVRAKAQPWTISPPDFFAGPESVRAALAAVTGLDADGIAIGPAVSYGLANAAANIPLSRGQQVVVLAEEFPSGFYAWSAAASAAGAQVVTVPRPEDSDWTSSVLAAIDERTAVVSVPPCHWTDGGVVDLVRVGEAARAAQSALVVDASQWLGAAPLDVDAIRPDVVSAVGYKWLLGPFNFGCTWFAPHLRDGVPLEGNWLSRAGSENFSGLVDYTDDFQPGARRFDMGEVSSFIHAAMAPVALGQIDEWGVERIAATLRRSTDQIVADAEAIGLSATPAAHRSPHLVGLRLPTGAAADLPERLAAAGVHVSLRGDAIRVSPHLYNEQADFARLRAVLESSV